MKKSPKKFIEKITKLTLVDYGEFYIGQDKLYIQSQLKVLLRDLKISILNDDLEEILSSYIEITNFLAENEYFGV